MKKRMIFILTAIVLAAWAAYTYMTPVMLFVLNRPNFAQKIAASQKEDFLKDIPKITAHEHYKAGADIGIFFEAMKLFNEQKVVLFPTGGSPNNRGCVENMAELLEVAKKYPDKVIAFVSVDETDPNSPKALEEAVKGGARGLKLMCGHPNFYKVALDNPTVTSLFAKANELKIPVLLHISPLKFPTQMQEFENLLKKFPDLIVIAAHYGRTAPKFSETVRLMNTYPNLVMDVSMGGGLKRYQKEMAVDARGYRNFVIKYQNRLMWGTDVILTSKTNLEFLRGRIGVDMLVLGKPFYVDLRPGQDPTKVYLGLELPVSVLRKIFYENPRRILRLE